MFEEQLFDAQPQINWNRPITKMKQGNWYLVYTTIDTTNTVLVFIHEVTGTVAWGVSRNGNVYGIAEQQYASDYAGPPKAINDKMRAAILDILTRG